MISEQTKRKFEQIVKEMTPEQRSTLQAHLAKVPEEQRWQFVERIVAAHEANEAKTESPKVPDTPKHVKTEPKPSAPAEGKRRLKPAVKNTLAGIVLVALLVGIVVLAARNWNTIIGRPDPAESTAPVDTTVAETTVETTPSPTPTITPTPEPTRVPVAANHPDLSGLTIVIDPGHQETTDNEQELYASWLSATKPRCTCGTTGVVTEIPEYELTLNYSIIIADYLEQCGATVILTRDANDVNISNQERAEIAVSNNADLFLRIHADAAGDSMASGVRVYTPDSGSYTDTSPSYAEELAELVAEAEGLEVKAVRATSLYTGLNYANTIRSFQISLGFLSNSDDEAVLTNEDNMAAVAEAISNFCEDLYN